MKKIYEDYRDKGIRIVAVDTRGDMERAKNFIETNELPFTFLQVTDDFKGVLKEDYRIGAVPTNFILNGEGQIIYYHLGFDAGDEKKIEEEIRSLL